MNNLSKNIFIVLLVFNGSLFHASDLLRSFVNFNCHEDILTKESSKEKLLEQVLSSNKSGFEENKGQVVGFDGSAHPEVKFIFQDGNTQIFLLEKGIAYQFTKRVYPENYLELMGVKATLTDFARLNEMQKVIRTESFRMDMNLVGANPTALVTTEHESADYKNFYNGNSFDVHNFQKIIYHEIYPGIDWIIYRKNGNVKYDFVVKPFADPSIIKMEFKNHEDISLNNDGSYTLKSALGNITEKAPISIQNKNNIITKFDLFNNIISFKIGEYDPTQILTIDPTLIWATYFGGPAYNGNYGTECTTDSFGNVFLSGYTDASTNIAAGGHQIVIGGTWDAFLVKFNDIGIRLWSTYYGGSGPEYGSSCASDISGNIYLAGWTGSNSNIASGGHQSTFLGGTYDAFLVKFNSNGLRLWGTYYGGTGFEYGFSCCTDPFSNVYLAGTTTSTADIASGGHDNTFSGINDGYLVKFNSNGIRQWGTYYGDTDNDFAWNCTTDAVGNVYLTGHTSSQANISLSGHQNSFSGGYSDAFLVKFKTNGARIWATYYGGSGIDYGYGCTVDQKGNVYMCGVTTSTSNIAFGGFQNNISIGGGDALLVKFDSIGTRIWATYYGGSFNQQSYSCATDYLDNVYLAGLTSSTNNIASGGYQNNIGGYDDGFLIKFGSNGLRIWGTYYGGSDWDSGNSCAVDKWGSVYLCGSASSSLNIAYNGYQNIIIAWKDAYLAKFCDTPPNPPISIYGDTLICQSGNQIYSIGLVPGAKSYVWNLPIGWSGSSATNSIVVVPNSSGVLSVTAFNDCGASSTKTLDIIVGQSPKIVVSSIDSLICEGEGAVLFATGANSYTWSSGALNDSTAVSPVLSTTYIVIGVDSAGCSDTTTFVLIVDPCTKINDYLLGNDKINIYPNPNNGLLQLKMEKFENTNCSIYNSLGEKILDYSITQIVSTLDMTLFSNGIYLGVIRRNNEILVKTRISKQ